MQLIQGDKILQKKIENVNKKIPGTSKFVVIQELNRLTKISFNARMSELSKNIVTNKQAEIAFDLGNENGKKIKISSNV